MINYIVSINDHDVFKENFAWSMKQPWIYDSKSWATYYTPNAEDLDSMAKKYNHAINEIELNGLEDDDILVFAHEDVKLLDETFVQKLEMIFKKKKDIGLVGIYGTTLFPESGGWWMADRSQHGRGHIMQGLPDKPTFHMQDRIGFFEDVASVDGCMIAIKGSMINEGFRFDETIEGYHFYDVDASFTILEMGYKVAVADILIEHASHGPLGESWENARVDFINKWKDKGYIFPITIQQFVD